MDVQSLSPEEVCYFFGISKSTLFRWEQDGRISPVKRTVTGSREYFPENVREISAIMVERIKERYADACRRESIRELGELHQTLSFLKILSHNELGAAELCEYQTINPDIITKLVLFLRLFPLRSKMFYFITEALLNQSRRAMTAVLDC